jgi:hypothetical protein
MTNREYKLQSLQQLVKEVTNRAMSAEQIIACALNLAEVMLEHKKPDALIRFDQGEKIEGARAVCFKGKRLCVLGEAKTYGDIHKMHLDGTLKKLPKGVHSYTFQIKIDGEWI